MERSCGVIPVKKHASSFLFLLIQHRGGHWGFPKGHMEKGESTMQTAIRELKEETNVELSKIFTSRKFFERYSYHRAGKTRHKTVVYYVGIVGKGRVRIQKEEIKKYEWLTYAAAMRRLKFIEIKKILASVSKYLDSQSKAKKS